MRWLNKFAHQLRHSLRYKLLLLTVLPLAATAIGFSLMAAYWTSSYSDRQLYMKVSADLSVAQGTLNILENEQLDTIKQFSNTYEFRTNLQKSYSLGIQKQLNEVRRSRNLDFFRFIRAENLKLINEPSLKGIEDRLNNGESLSGLTLVSEQEMEQIQPGLSQQAKVLLIDTPYADISEKQTETRAMVLRTLEPVFDDFNRLIGILDAGVIFNRNTDVVDMIRDLVYGEGTLPIGGIGTVTLFLDDIRISTNVPQYIPNETTQQTPQELSITDRAIGTRVSKVVKEHVLRRGNTWIDRAFVVNDWYISAYKPLLDINNQKIGMIYTGFTEAPFSKIYYKTLIESIIMIGMIMLLSGLVVFNKGRSLLLPLTQLHNAVSAVKKGDMEKRIGEISSSDELSDLAIEFDKMLDLLETREAQVRLAKDNLEHQVEQRTRSLRRRTEALKEHIKLLKSTRQQLLDKEKLAVLGELTAGIAHEINNPAAVILGSVDLVMDELGSAADPAREELDMIIKQVYRIRSLINNLLQYSRPGHYVDEHYSQDINRVCEDTLLLVRHALDKQQVHVSTQYQASCLVEVNIQQIQQVLVNLILNASHASEEEGTISLITRNWFKDNKVAGACIEVSDQGHGIPQEQLDRIFEAFYTTKESGTGLGLSVSSGIIRRHGGSMTVESEVGQGTTFKLCLPEHHPDDTPEDDYVSDLLEGLAQAERTNRRALQDRSTD